MGANENAISRLAAETKALVLLNEYRLQRLNVLELKSLLGTLSASDLERGGILEGMRQKADVLGVPRQDVESLIAALTGDTMAPVPAPPGAAAPPPAPARPSTARLHRFSAPGFDAPEPALPNPSETPTFKVKSRDLKATEHTFNVVRPGARQQPAAPPLEPPPPKKDAFFGSEASRIGGTQIIRRMASRKVLLADDDARIRMVFRKRLEEAHFIVEEVSNGEEAWERLQNETFAAAILDMKMPGLHGLEILARLTASGSQMPVVICSAYEQLKDEFVVSTYPHLRYLVKPVPVDKLLGALHELVPDSAD